MVLYALAKQLGPQNGPANDILKALVGHQITKGQSQDASFGMEVKLPQILTVKAGSELGSDKSDILTIVHLEHFVDQLLDLAFKEYRRVIIAVDDLERCPNQGNIKLMLESTLDLLRDKRCSFILTGRTLTIVEDIYFSGLDIFNETIPLKPLSSQQLRSIAIRTLNLVRLKEDLHTVMPFTEEVIDTIASSSFGIPRQFVLLCGKILKIAIENGYEELDSNAFKNSYEQLQLEISNRDIPPDIRRILYLGLQQGGFSISKDADLDKVFDVLGVTTLRQFVDFADNMVQQDLLQRFTDHRGEILYRLSPGVEKLAESGAGL